MEKVIKYGAGSAVSILNPIALATLVITVILIFLLPRRHIIIAMLFFLILIPTSQQFVIGGIHIFFYRIILIIGLIQARRKRGTQKESLNGEWNAIDKSFSLYVLIRAIVFSLQYLDSAAVINQIGFIWDSLAGYFLMRLLINDYEDINRAVKCVSYIFALLAVGMLIEQLYMVNPFGYIGGQMEPELRDGSIRSFGAFSHTLTVGTAGATAIPLFLLLWYQGRQRAATVSGIIAATIMVVTSHSSGPLMAYGAGIIGLIVWPWRKKMQLIRWAIAVSLLVLHLVMKAPVWFLIAHIDLTGSSSSYHRANLIDQFIQHFSEWWLLGTQNYSTWAYDMWDVQNQYVSAGFGGGLGAFICFIAVIVYGFSMIGNARNRSTDEQQERRLWALGAALFSYVVALIGVNLFDQSQFLWYMLLAMISAATIAISPTNNLDPEVRR